MRSGIVSALRFAGLLLATVGCCVSASADADTESRLREALRATTEQLRQTEAENASLKAKQSIQPAPASTTETGHPAVGAYKQTIAELRRRLSNSEAEAAKSKAAYAEIVAAQTKKNAEQAKLEVLTKADKERGEVCRAKNQKLIAIANEILDRYQNVGFAGVLSAKEPFVGSKRVELQNEAQDYLDKLRDNEVRP